MAWRRIATDILPLPVLHGERVKVRGRLHKSDSRRVPLTRRCAPTSPRKRGEVKMHSLSKNYPLEQ